MDRRLRKQFIIGVIFFAALTLIGSGIYLVIKPSATCFDNKKNQGETAVDCGGPCITCDLKNNPPISVLEQPVFFATSGQRINIFFRLVNSNSEWGAKSFSYQLFLSDSNGKNQKLTFADFILPKETKYIFLPQVEVETIPEAISLEIDPQSIVWAKPVEGINLKLGELFILTGVKILEPTASVQTQKNIYTITKTLKFGIRDPEVSDLQAVLSQIPSFYPEAQVTGYFGKATEAAVKRFQEKYGIRATGEVGPQTRAKLNELYGSQEQSASGSFVFDAKVILKKGMQGIDIVKLQQALSLDSGSSPQGMVSGTFDQATENAVKEFQQKYNIEVTGQVGPLTAAKLNELVLHSAEDKPQLTEESFESFEAKLKVEGNVYNSTPFNWKKGEIGVILCDKNQKPVAIGATPLENINSGKITPFSIIWRYDLPGNLIICTKEAHVNVLDLDNAFVPHD